MSFIESFQIALDSLAANKLRAILTMLGIIIGVAAVITMLGIGRGAQASIEAQIQANGTNLLFVRPGAQQQGGVAQAQGSAQTLTYEDARAIVESGDAPAVSAVAPEFNSGGQVVYQGTNINTRITGVTPEYTDVRNMTVANGEFINASHVQGRSTVAVLGASVAQNLFNGEDPIGQNIRINNSTYKVIGVLTAKGGTGFGSQDDQIFIPLTTVYTRLFGGNRFRGSQNVNTINVQVVDAAQNDAAIQQVSDILRQRHRISYSDDFTIVSQQDILQTAATTTGVFTLFLGSIAAISLLVGGIGIMNIMLVSVTERTREIGLRKAVGARRGDVLTQFLVEATVLSVMGGLLGVGLAFLFSRAFARFNVGNLTLTPVIGLDSVLLATIFSIAVGLFFGAYPANRAASLNPIDALRYE